MKWFAFYYKEVKTAIFDQSLVGKLSRELGTFAHICIDGRLAKHNAVAYALGAARQDKFSSKTHVLLVRAPDFRTALDRAPEYSEPNKKDFYKV